MGSFHKAILTLLEVFVDSGDVDGILEAYSISLLV